MVFHRASRRALMSNGVHLSLTNACNSNCFPSFFLHRPPRQTRRQAGPRPASRPRTLRARRLLAPRRAPSRRSVRTRRGRRRAPPTCAALPRAQTGHHLRVDRRHQSVGGTTRLHPALKSARVPALLECGAACARRGRLLRSHGPSAPSFGGGCLDDGAGPLLLACGAALGSFGLVGGGPAS